MAEHDPLPVGGAEAITAAASELYCERLERMAAAFVAELQTAKDEAAARGALGKIDAGIDAYHPLVRYFNRAFKTPAAEAGQHATLQERLVRALLALNTELGRVIDRYPGLRAELLALVQRLQATGE